MEKFSKSLVLAMVFCGSAAWAQVTTGTISGVVHDATGAVVPGASVTVRNLETGITRTLSTDAGGRYRAPNLNVGRYEVQVSLSGFQSALRSGITLTVGQEALVNITLEVGQVTERVEVTGEAPLIESTRSDISGVIEERQVSDLPLNGRSYLQLAQLQPGVVAVRNTASVSYGGKAQVLATAGSQGVTGLFLLDGTDISDYLLATSPGGASGMAIGVDMIREFRVLTSSFSAEYGRTAGGVLAVVSKSGTNELKGTAFWFHRNDNLDARNFFDGTRKPELKRNQFGGTVGGPIVRDKTFFLGSFEGLRERLGRTSVAIVPDTQAHQGYLPDPATRQLVFVGVAPGVKPFLDLFPLPTGQNFGNGTAEWRGSATQPTDEDFASVRIDHIFSEKDSLYGRYTFRDGTIDDPFGSTPVPGFPAPGTNRTHFTSAEETHVFSPSVLNSFRVSFNRNARANPLPSVPPEISIALLPNRGAGPITIGGVNQLGQKISRPSFPTLNLYELQDTVNFTRGRHSMKMGTDILRAQSNFNYEQGFNGSYRINSVRDFLTGRSSFYTGALPGSDGYRGFRWTTTAFFMQDEFRASSNLTLNLGLRYERYGNPGEVNDKVSTLIDPLRDTQMTLVKSLFASDPSSKYFAPRIGFAWSPFQNGKLAIRGGYGVYFDRIHVNVWRGNVNPPFATQIQVTNAPFPNPLAGGTVAQTALSPGDILPYRGFKYPYAQQWNFTLQQEIVPSTVVSASYAGSRGVHIALQGDLNLNSWEIRDGQKFFPAGARPLNPAFGSMANKQPQGNSFYHSLQLNLRRRMSAGLQFQLAYTWSKAIDEGTTFGISGTGNAPANVPDLFDPKLSRGLGDNDMRHNFVFSSSYELPIARGSRWLGGWQFGEIISLTSGIPFSPILGFNRARSSAARQISDAPDRVKTVTVHPGNPDQYFDLTAFQLPSAGFFGNAGRNSIIGPGLANVDFSVLKNTPLNERVNMQWRFEVFNLFNHANFATPGDSGTLAEGGTVIFTSAGGGIPEPTAGKMLRTVTSSRQIQIGLKINF